MPTLLAGVALLLNNESYSISPLSSSSCCIELSALSPPPVFGD